MVYDVNGNVMVQIDDTLTVANAAADAKATGDAVTNLRSAIAEQTRNLWVWDNTITLIRGTTNYYQIEYAPVDNALTLSFSVVSADVTSVLVTTHKNGSQVTNQPVNLSSGRTSVTLSNVDFDHLRVALRSSTPTGDGATITNMQLEAGSVATTYVPHLSAVDSIVRNDINDLKDSATKLTNAYLPQALLPKYSAFTCVNKHEINLTSSSHILAYGDSITQGGTWGTSWIDFVCQIIGCTATNKAVSGALFGQEVRTSNYWLSTQIGATSDSEWSAATLVIIAAGTNDAGYDTTDTELTNKVQSAITAIRANTQAPILFVTPIKRGPNDNDTNYFELPKVSGIIEHVALLNKCSVVCGLNFPIPSHDEGVITGMMSGYIHPNSDGGYVYAVCVLQSIL